MKCEMDDMTTEEKKAFEWALNQNYNSVAATYARILAKYIRNNAEEENRLEDMLFEMGAMEKPPCFVCGYNGPGYFQPDKHPCAEKHHKLCKVRPAGNGSTE